MTKIKFENSPSTKTPINAENLNKLNNVVISSTEPTTGEEVWLQKSKNLFSGGILLNKFINANGEENSNAEAKIVDYIKVTPNITYTFSAKSSVNGTVRIHGYNESRVWVSQITTVTTSSSYNTTFTIPSNVEYIRISMPLNDTNIQLEQGSIATSYEPYTDKKIYTKNDNGDYEEFYNEAEHNKEIYSTREQRIGTWLGKPLYRTVIEIEKTTAGDKAYTYNLSNIDQVANIYGNLYTDNAYVHIPYYIKSSNYLVPYIIPPQNSIGFNAPTDGGTGTIKLIVEFTKKSD